MRHFAAAFARGEGLKRPGPHGIQQASIQSNAVVLNNLKANHIKPPMTRDTKSQITCVLKSDYAHILKAVARANNG